MYITASFHMFQCAPVCDPIHLTSSRTQPNEQLSKIFFSTLNAHSFFRVFATRYSCWFFIYPCNNCCSWYMQPDEYVFFSIYLLDFVRSAHIIYETLRKEEVCSTHKLDITLNNNITWLRCFPHKISFNLKYAL